MATKYFMSGGVNNNWSADTNWSTTASAGPNNTTHAVAGDDVILDVGSPNCTVDAASAAATLTCTAYTNTLTYNQNLALTGNVTYSSLMTVSADVTTRVLTITPTAGATLTAGTKTHPCKLKLAGSSQTHVLADAWICSGVLEANSATTLNGSTISAVGLLMTAAMSGTTVITLTGGTWSGTSALKNSLTLAGNVTTSGNVAYNTGTLTYTSGTITTTGTILTVADLVTFDTGGMTWDSVSYTGSTKTWTLNSLFLATTLSLSSTSALTFAGAFGFTVGTFSAPTISTASKSLTFTQGNTYTVTTALNVSGSASFQWTFVSSSATLLTAFVLQSPATQSVAWVNATRIDSSAGLMIHSLNGVLTNTLNWDNPGASAMWLY